jgi:hypothetical protein
VKLLLDENLPHKLRSLLTGHDCFTATWMGWSGIENGELLRRAADAGFDAFISNDRGLEHEQNRATLPLAVVVLLSKDNKLATIERAVPQLVAALEGLKPRTFVKISAGD